MDRKCVGCNLFLPAITIISIRRLQVTTCFRVIPVMTIFPSTFGLGTLICVLVSASKRFSVAPFDPIIWAKKTCGT